MIRSQTLSALPLTVIGIICANLLGIPSYAGNQDIGEKGASVYCFMRKSGNPHEISWDASYEIIKRQKSSIFKTSPKHAAVMIIETVVQNPDKYQNCGNFLGDLFGASNLEDIAPVQEDTTYQNNEEPAELKKGDRYSY